MLTTADCANRNRLASVVEWSKSSPSMPFESKKAVRLLQMRPRALSCCWRLSWCPFRTLIMYISHWSCVQIGPRAESLDLEASCDAERMGTVMHQREE